MSAEPCLDLSVKASLDNLQEIRSYIDRTGASLGVSDRALENLRLVVDEAVTNVIIHGYGDVEGNVEVRMEAIGNSVIVRIRDRAESFVPDQIDAPQLKTPLKDRPFGGMGIFLIKNLTDEAEFLPLPDGGNEIRLVKHGAIQNGG